jgi:hypothetical protein
MSVAPEQVKAPAGDAVLFRSSPARTFAAVFAVLMVSFALVAPVTAFFSGGAANWRSTIVQGTVIALLASAGYAWSTRGSITTWVRVSAGGLEIAAQGSDPILLAWPDVAAVVVRRSGLRTVLDVVPVDLDRVHPVQGEGPGWPTMTDVEGRPAFTADLSEVWPGPRRLRRELHGRMHPEG